MEELAEETGEDPRGCYTVGLLRSIGKMAGFGFASNPPCGLRKFHPNLSRNSGHSRSGLNGTAVKRMPVASASALPSAAATGL